MDLFRYETYAFRVLHESSTEGFAFALPKFHADAVEYVFLGRAEDDSYNVFPGHPVTTPLTNKLMPDGYNVDATFYFQFPMAIIASPSVIIGGLVALV